MLQRDPVKFLAMTARRYGDLFRFRLAHRQVYLLNRPEYVKHVLQSEEAHYCKGAFRGANTVVFGKGVAFANGDEWRRLRQELQPFFHREQITKFSTSFVDTITQLLVSWEEPARRGQAVEFTDEFSRLFHALVIQMFLGDTLAPADVDTARHALKVISAELHRYSVLGWLRHLPTPSAQRFNRALTTLEGIIARLVSGRRQTAFDNDLLSTMIAAGFTDKEIRDQVITLLFAGQDTASNALVWACYLVSQHPEVEARLLAELDGVLKGQTPTFDKLSDLTYTRCVLEESMRLYPPAYVIARLAVADDIIDSYVIQAGSVVLLSQYLMHRHPAYWPDPERFDPGRFSQERSMGRPRYSYFPFGVGRRSCIGLHLAMTEMLFTITMIYQRYVPRAVAGHPVAPKAGIILRPRNGMPMTLMMR